MTYQYYLNLIKRLGFGPLEGADNVYQKKYSLHDGYAVTVDFNNKSIEYGAAVILGDKTTSNFESSENFVVLECVDRCLETGYTPSCITLEQKWPMGRKEKGKLDILIKDQSDTTYLMIECKAWGAEYDKEKKKMLRDGGQLFSYYLQDKAARFLCLYSSRFADDAIHYNNGIIHADEQWRVLNNQKEIYTHWNKDFADNGVFDSPPYHISLKAMTGRDLKALTEEDSGYIFNQFAEILRHNVVSDKPNAFNKILNLFLCKIIDEDRAEDEELQFQWVEGKDTPETLQTRLNNLYKTGMKQFLGLDIADYTDQQLQNKLENIENEEERKAITRMFEDLRLKKNPEFAFKEVYDSASFEANGQVVKEVVILLQRYRFRYSHKQPFLGSFFELLLNTSIKQESGQFFTPVPVAKFIVSSLPVNELIQQKIKRRELDVLPRMIDYAAGSGHFLTEWMDEVQQIVESFDTRHITPSIAKKLNSWKANKFSWARDCVYGVEADYRLVKTAKVSAFLNGDGEATIIRADGLDSFEKSTDYKDALRCFDTDHPQNNTQFDVLTANPPYSVSAFKNTLKHGDESFDLYQYLTDKSSEIECLFVERAKQLLKPGGIAGIILPSSILNNTGIYTKTREIIQKYFYIRAIVKLGSNTFMATGTSTVVLFLERRANDHWQRIAAAINIFFERPKDVTVDGIEKAFSKYAEAVYDDLSFKDYADWVDGKINEAMQAETLFRDYRTWFDGLTEIRDLRAKKAFKAQSVEKQEAEITRRFHDKMTSAEKERILHFLLAHPQQTLLVEMGEKDAEKRFLGYEFSNRRGHEGIRMRQESDGSEATRLYDANNPNNPEKANYYVRQALLGNYPDISPSLQGNIALCDTVDLFDFTGREFEKVLSLAPKKKEFTSNWPMVRLGKVADIRNGGTPSTKKKGYWDGDIPWATLVDTKNKYLYSTARRITEEGMKESSAVLLPINTIIFSSRATIGDVTIAKIETCTNQGYKNFVCNADMINHEYLYYVLNFRKGAIEELAAGMTYREISKLKISNFSIPLPPLPEQERIVSEIEVAETALQQLREEPARLGQQAQELFVTIFGDPAVNPNNWPMVRMNEVCEIVRGGSPRPIKDYLTIEDGISWIKIGDTKNTTKYICGTAEKIKPEGAKFSRMVNEGDFVLSNSMSFGRPYIMKIKGCIHDGWLALRDLKVNQDYLYGILSSDFMFKRFKESTSGTVVDNLNIGIVKHLSIPLPPLPLQRKFSEQIQQLEKQQEAVRAALPEAERAFADLQQQLFAGVIPLSKRQ